MTRLRTQTGRENAAKVRGQPTGPIESSRYKPTVEAGEDFAHYYDASDFRIDHWNKLKQLTALLARHEDAEPDTVDLRARIKTEFVILEQLENYFAFPGLRSVRQSRALLDRGDFITLAQHTRRILHLLESDAYRHRPPGEIHEEESAEEKQADGGVGEAGGAVESRPYFEVLVVDDLQASPDQQGLLELLLALRSDEDRYIYDVVVVGSLEDAIIATFVNYNIQSVIIRYGFPIRSSTKLPILRNLLSYVDVQADMDGIESRPSWALGSMLESIRPEIDQFLVTDDPVRSVAGHTGRSFRRIFYKQEDTTELHVSILRGIQDRYETPFFDALREYSQRPTGVFHALPISRGKSIAKSRWIRDLGEFYGDNLFLAETSATMGGLDSLLQPQGPLKTAQDHTARAFGARRSFFVTNGTSTANKIAIQALLSPGEISLVSRDCHKSHHYALMLAGAMPIYMDPYPLENYNIYGAVPLRNIKRHLIELKQAGKLDRVRMLILTNCTIDGIVYQTDQVMEEVLAIKPDMIFVWDEAWFGFARFSYTYRSRTAMEAARDLQHRFADPAYRERYKVWKSEFDRKNQDEVDTWIDTPLMADPDAVRIRIYATQSTHKTLTSLRQGSMIHIYDQDFGALVGDAFEDAYMMHTTTSPNYQILASLDVGRRQVELEGYRLVEQSIALAMMVRERIAENPALRRYFQVLTPGDLVPSEHQPSGLREFYTAESGYSRFDKRFCADEFVVDPTRITVQIGNCGMDGDSLRTLLMDKYDIQINKTSRNTVLFMITIGTSRSAVEYLLEVLTQIARDLDFQEEHGSSREYERGRARVRSLTRNLPPLPNFSRFHERFSFGQTTEGDLREAFFAGRSDSACDFLPLHGSIQEVLQSGREHVAASFVTPYPPGCPILVPGQVISPEILAYLMALDVREIHGYSPEYGLRVFKQEVLESKPMPPPSKSP